MRGWGMNEMSVKGIELTIKIGELIDYFLYCNFIMVTNRKV